MTELAEARSPNCSGAAQALAAKIVSLNRWRSREGDNAAIYRDSDTRSRGDARFRRAAYSLFVEPVRGVLFLVRIAGIRGEARAALDPQAALVAINAFRAENGRNALVLDERLSRAADMQSETQAARGWIGHDGADGSTPKARAMRAGYQAKIASENVASGLKSFSDVLRFWEQSSGHRENLLRPNVTAIGVAMAKTKSGRPYWTLVLGAE